MIVFLTDKMDVRIPINSDYFITCKPVTGHGKPFSSTIYLGGDSALKEINVKETAEEVGDKMSGLTVSGTEERLPEGIKRGKDGKIREGGKLISKEKLEELGLSNTEA